MASMMSVPRKVTLGAILAAGLVSTVIVGRNLGCGRRSGPPVREARGAVRPVPFRCNLCKHDFVGYEVEWVPGTGSAVGLHRYRRPSDSQWVPGTNKEKVAELKAVVCPKCGAHMGDLTMLLEIDLPSP